MSEPIVYLNGQILPVSQAHISVLDRGFLFGDGVYEVIPAYGGHLLRPFEHLQRLQNSLDGIRLNNPLNQSQWLDIMQQLLEQNPAEDQCVYLHISRGVVAEREHTFSDDATATVFVMVSPLLSVSRQALEKGVSAITLEDIRWRACHIKATTLLVNSLLKQQAKDEGAAEALLVRDGQVTEGTASNLFVVQGSQLITPPVSPLLLPGVTRDLVLELARNQDIDCLERDISVAELKAADEIWITSSTREIVPVVELDGEPVGNGQSGPIWETMIDIYQAYKVKLRQGEQL